MSRVVALSFVFFFVTVLQTSAVEAQVSYGDLLARSVTFEKAQNYVDAIRTLEAAHPQYPKDYTLNLRLGWLYYLTGKHANAIQYYEIAIVSAPASIEARLGLTLPLLAQQKYQQAEMVTKQIVQVDPMNYFANLRLAFSLRLQGKLDPAEQICMSMLKRYPSDVSFLAELALLKLEQEDLQTAKSLMQRILSLDPENVTAKREIQRL